MKVAIRISSNTLSDDIKRALKAAQNPQPALEAAAAVIVEHAKRAFIEPGLRPVTWPALAASTIRAKQRAHKSLGMLIREGHLIRTPRIIQSSRRRVLVGSNLFYARFHQLGTKRIPARPFWPFDAQGRVRPRTLAICSAVMRRRLGIAK